jgi:hypothetical protein
LRVCDPQEKVGSEGRLRAPGKGLRPLHP